MCEWAPDKDRIIFGRAVRSASDIEAGVPDHQHRPGTPSACGLSDHGGLRKITTHRSAYESVAGRSIAVPACEARLDAQWAASAQLLPVPMETSSGTVIEKAP